MGVLLRRLCLHKEPELFISFILLILCGIQRRTSSSWVVCQKVLQHNTAKCFTNEWRGGGFTAVSLCSQHMRGFSSLELHHLPSILHLILTLAIRINAAELSWGGMGWGWGWGGCGCGYSTQVCMCRANHRPLPPYLGLTHIFNHIYDTTVSHAHHRTCSSCTCHVVMLCVCDPPPPNPHTLTHTHFSPYPRLQLGSITRNRPDAGLMVHGSCKVTTQADPSKQQKTKTHTKASE